MVSLFAGGGLFPLGAKQAGVEPLGGIEFDAKKAEIYRLNHGSLIEVKDILNVSVFEWQKYKGRWLMQASPPCKNSSRAKRHKNEKTREEGKDLDLELAKAVCRSIHIAKPKHFILENVRDYALTDSYKEIKSSLNNLGYSCKKIELNSVDFGVPQSRDRMFLIASQIPDIIEGFDLSPYYKSRIISRVSWYETLKPYLETCKTKILAPYQVNAISKAIALGKIGADDPALLVGGAGSNPGKPGVTHYLAPSPTVRSCEGMRSGGWRPCVVLKEDFLKTQGEAIGYKLSSRCLLALQGVPDSFKATTETVTGFVAGNGVSVPVARALCEALIRSENRLS